jgi:hypothetical protein
MSYCWDPGVSVQGEYSLLYFADSTDTAPNHRPVRVAWRTVVNRKSEETKGQLEYKTGAY